MLKTESKHQVLDREAMNDFCLENGDGLLRFLLARGVSSTDAEDVAQECLLTLWNKRHKVRDGKYRHYLFGIAKLQANNWRRKVHLERTRKDETIDTEVLHAIADPQSIVPPDEDGNLIRLREAMAQLPVRMREVVQIIYFENCSPKEAARRLNISENAVHQMDQRARKQLKSMVENESRLALSK